MAAVQIIALICAVATSPAECTENTALQVQNLRYSKEHLEAPNELACMFSGQASMAGLAIAPREGEYLKIRCVRAPVVNFEHHAAVTHQGRLHVRRSGLVLASGARNLNGPRVRPPRESGVVA